MTVAELIAALGKVPPDTQVLVAYDSMVCVSDASDGGVWLATKRNPRSLDQSDPAVYICADGADIDYKGGYYTDARRLDVPPAALEDQP